MSSTAKGTLAVILSAILFGLMPIAAKFIYANGSNSFTLTLHRFFFSIPFLWLVMRIKGERIPVPSQKDLRRLLLVALGNIATPVLLYLSYDHISTGLATTLHFVYPVLVISGGVLFYRDKADRIRVICTILCLSGILSFYTPGGSSGTLGILIALSSGFTFAFYILLLDHGVLQHFTPLQVGFYFGIIGSIGLLILNLSLNTLRMDLTFVGWAASIIFSFGTSGIAVVLFQYGVKLVGGQNTSLLSTFEPLTSVVVGILFMNERFTFQSGLGILLILSAIFILGLSDRRKAALANVISKS